MRPALRVVGLAARFTRPLIVLLLVGLFARVNLDAGREPARLFEEAASPTEAVLPEQPRQQPPQWASPVSLVDADRPLPPSPAAPVESGSGAGAASIFVPRPSPTPDLLARSDEPNGRDGESRVLPQREAAEPQAGPRELPLPDGLSAGVLDASPVRRLVIPALKLDVEVVDAPFVDRTWDISELGGKVAWLTGTSWPGQMGNTALAGHITARRIGEGPFRYLHRLRAGDPVYVYTADYLYTYRVREQVVVKIEDVHVLAPTDSPQLTLLTCTDWDEKLSTYRNRRVVFADLVSVAPVLAGQ